jgi:hypothetical protein
MLRYATAELVERRTDERGMVALTFATDAGGPFEVAFDGRLGALVVPPEARVLSREEAGGMSVLVIEATGSEATLLLEVASDADGRSWGARSMG